MSVQNKWLILGWVMPKRWYEPRYAAWASEQHALYRKVYG